MTFGHILLLLNSLMGALVFKPGRGAPFCLKACLKIRGGITIVKSPITKCNNSHKYGSFDFFRGSISVGGVPTFQDFRTGLRRFRYKKHNQRTRLFAFLRTIPFIEIRRKYCMCLSSSRKTLQFPVDFVGKPVFWKKVGEEDSKKRHADFKRRNLCSH